MPKSSGNQRQFFLFCTKRIAMKSTCFLPAIVVSTVLVISNAGGISAAEIPVGAIIDVNTRSGKEIKVAMEVAARNFNESSMNLKLSLHFRNPGENPLHAANAAEELIQEKNVQALVGMNTWEQTALVAEVGKKSQVPIISFAEAAAHEPLTRKQWPSLFPLANDLRGQFRCIASIIGLFNWRKVIVIYEVDSYGGDSGVYAAFSEALRTIDVEIEHRVVFPLFSSLSDPKIDVQEAMAKLLSKQSRVFIVLRSSLSLAAHLFKEAKRLRLSGTDSVWIITDSIASHLDSLGHSVISNMEGFIGVRTYSSENTPSVLHFKSESKKIFRSEYPAEDSSEVGIHALRAYDGINAIIHAIKKMDAENISRPELGKSISDMNFAGLSGNICFRKSQLLRRLSILGIINVVGKSYRELGFWSSKVGFSSSPKSEIHQGRGIGKFLARGSFVNWPGNLDRAPKGWCMPTDVKPLRIGVPARTAFEKFVKVKWNASTSQWIYSGYCIDIFSEILKILSYPFPYEFYPVNGTYDELVNCVANKTFDAVIGDVTILSKRSRLVEFTQPFAESGVTMIVTLKAENKAWIFLKPFSKEMWAVTVVILIYTVFIIWLLEHQLNPEFEGPWWNQIGTALWFIFASLFFVHRERVNRSYTRAVVLVWLFLVFTLTSSYTASLSSMLTVPRLRPNVTDVEWLKRNNAIVGCDGDSFVKKYLEDVLSFKPGNIRVIDKEEMYRTEFENGNITAAFLELTHGKAFLSKHCKGYTVANKNSPRLGRDRFGGLGFVFQKGSPWAADVSQAILTLSERGKLKELEIRYFSPSPKCSQSSDDTDSLNWQSFWGLYVFSAGTSTICYLLASIHQICLRWRKEKK